MRHHPCLSWGARTLRPASIRPPTLRPPPRTPAVAAPFLNPATQPRRGRAPTPPAQAPRTPQRTPPATARPGPAHTAAPAAARARPAPHSPAPKSMGRKSQHRDRSDRRAATRAETQPAKTTSGPAAGYRGHAQPPAPAASAPRAPPSRTSPCHWIFVFFLQVKHFLGCKKSTKSNTCGSLFTCSGPYFFHGRKLQNYRTHAFLDMGLLRAFCTTFRRKRFIARNATDFRTPSLTICRMATSTEKRQKVGLFQRFFQPSMSIFPRFPTFPALSNFYSRT